jgi:hypothetical protein
MPLDNYFTKPDYSRQLKQYSGTSATFSGATNILEKFSIKSIEVDTEGAVLGDALLYDAGNNKFRPGFPGSFSGSVISNGFLLSYVSGLTYNVGAGSYNVNGTTYPYLGENFNIISGQSGGSRFDLVYITAASPTVFIRTGITTTNPSLPNLQVGELEVGYIFVPANFTGGTGSTTIQTTGDSVFIYYNNGAGTGVQRAAVGANTVGSGDFSFATGVNSRAYGYNSNAFGYDTKASGYAQTVVGKYNTANDTDLFIVGYGADDSNRANAFNITNSGDTYANRKLFVTNVEIETTGATNGKVLKFNGAKFTPQLETITGATSFTGGTSIFSSITNNTLLFKSITGGSNVFLTESSGTIYVNVELSGASISGLTEIQSLTGGVSIISGKTGSTYFLYPLLGSGGTSVTLSNGKLLIYSDTSASTTGANVGPIAAAGVFYTKAINQLQFRRLSSATPSYLSIAESNELVLFNSTPPITGSTNATGSSIGVLASVSNKNIVGRALTGTNRVTVTQATDLITINSPIEVETGNAGTLSIYRSSSPIVYSSYTSTNNSGITVKLGTHTTPITSRTYTIPDVKKDANFVMTEGNQTINGKKEFISGITIGNDPQTSLDEFDQQFNHNIYNLFQPNDSKLEFFETISGISYISEKIYGDNGTKLLADSISGLSILKNSYYQFNLTSHVSGTVVSNLENIYVDSNGYDTNIVGKYNIYNFNGNPGSSYNSKLIGNYFESRVKTALVPQTIESFKTIQLGYFNSVYANSPIKKAYDIYITKPLVDGTEPFGGAFSAPLITSFASIYIEGKTTPPNPDVFKRNIIQTSNTRFTNAPWSLFAEGDRAYIGSTLVLYSALTLSSTTRGAWLDIGESTTTRPQINFASGGTAPTTPRIGDMWFDGNALRFRLSSSTVNLTSGGTGTGSFTGITDIQSAGTGNFSVISSVTNNKLVYRTISAGTNTNISYAPDGTLVINNTGISGSTSFAGITDIVSAGTGNFSVISSVTNNKLVYRTISAGTGMNITESNGTLIFVSTATGGTSSTGSTSGTSLGDGVKVLFSSDTTNLAFATLSSQTPSTLSIISSSTGVILFSAVTATGGGLLYGTATNGGTDTYTATVNGTVSSYQEGDSYIIKFADNNIGNSKIDINGVGPSVRIYKEINTALENDDIIGGKIYLITHDGTDFQLVSFNEGGGTGSTVSGNFLPLSGGTLTGGLSATTISATSIDRINYIDFNTGATVTSQTARLNWNDTDGTLELGLKGGVVKSKLNQGLVTRVVNKTTPLINLSGSSYHAVVVAGATGQRLSVKLAKGDNDANSAGTLGLVAEDIAANQEGFIVTVGLLQKINTTGSLQGETWNDGDVLYLSPTTAGQITNIKPQAPNHTVIIGYVEYAHAINGKIYVKIDNGYEIDELHNVRITGASDYNILRYDGVTYSSWTNSSINEVLSKTLLTRNIPATSQVAQVGSFYLYDKITITSATASVTVTSITSDVSISAYTPSIKFFAQTGVTVTFQNSTTLKTEGGLDAIIVGDNYDSITFTYNNDIGKYFQTNINNYI